MKKIALLFILGFTINANAGGLLFPNVEFEYAKIYLFNLDLDEPSHMDFRIYKDGIYAKSKLGNGTLLTADFHKKLQKVFARGIDELIMGLSKCYMPRHGIIYYSKDHEPVASLSICFECDKISVWSKTGYHFKDDYERFNIDKAEKQLRDLSKIVIAEKVPVYKYVSDVAEYFTYLKKDTAFTAKRTVNITVDQELNIFGDSLNDAVTSTWIHPAAKLSKKEAIDTLENTDGTLDIHHAVKYGKQTIFSFINGQLIEGRIYHSSIILPMGISTGMSVAEVYQKFNYKMPKSGYPSAIRMTGIYWMLQLNFKHQTLTDIAIKGH
ncbi:MAG: hypothetical protein ACI8ZM_001486 [Crocinitomix sp.]|jgi:hypothetical protein